MTLATDSLPNDLQALKALVSAQRAEIERLKMMIAKLRRTQFGRSSEQLDAMIDQLQLSLEELEVSQTELTPPTAPPLVPSLGANHYRNTCHVKFTSISPSRNALAVADSFASWVRMSLKYWNTSRRASK